MQWRWTHVIYAYLKTFESKHREFLKEKNACAQLSKNFKRKYLNFVEKLIFFFKTDTPETKWISRQKENKKT